METSTHRREATGGSRLNYSGVANDALFERFHRYEDQRAREELLGRFLPLARKLASRYMNPYEPFDDLVQVATVGLLGAIDRFDPERGASFPSFAIPTILGELKRYFRSTGWSAHVPRGAQELALRVDRAVRQLEGRLGRAPTVNELEDHLSLPTEDVLTGLEAGNAHYSVSLDAPAAAHGSEADPEPLASSLGSDDDRIGLVETRLSLSAAMKRLPYPEREALGLRLSKDLKQTEIAARLGCSQMQVSRLLRRAAATVHELTEPPVQRNGRTASS
jgi:RNA polymerase sigma-B factor